MDLPELNALQAYVKEAAHLRELLTNPNGPKEQKKLQNFHVFLLKYYTAATLLLLSFAATLHAIKN